MTRSGAEHPAQLLEETTRNEQPHDTRNSGVCAPAIESEAEDATDTVTRELPALASRIAEGTQCNEFVFLDKAVAIGGEGTEAVDACAKDEPASGEPTDPLRDLVSPFGGLIGQIIPLPTDPGDPPFPVAMATLGDLTQILPEVAGATGGASTRNQLDGAGGDIDADRAVTIALAEALERYSSCVYHPEQFIVATADELGKEALDLDTVPRCSPTELAHPRCPVVTPDKSAPMRWVRGVSLSGGRLRWVPAVMTYLHIPPQYPGERFVLPISTGCATHRTPVEALRNAICEVVERDAICLTWLQQLPLPRVEIDEVDGDLSRFLGLLAERDTEVHLFDATTDVGIPTIYSLEIAPHHASLSTLVMGATDLNPRRAVAKVLREAAAARIGLAVEQPERNPDEFASAFDGARYMGRPEHAEAFRFLLDTSDRRRLSGLPVLATGDPTEDLRFILGQLDRLGLEAIAVDLTTDEALRAGMHVVRVIIPGLQPLSFSHRARYLAHPRLFSAPARLGYPVRAEADLNPWPQPFA